MEGEWIRGEWITAFEREDGYQMMILLRRYPWLVTVKHRGRTVLHLGVRNNWFGLVWEVLRQFIHLQSASSRAAESWEVLRQFVRRRKDEYASSRARAGSLSEPSQEQSSRRETQLSQFRDLIVAKEGDGEPSLSEGRDWSWQPLYAIPKASGFDVFAMALIQGHQAINKILLDAVSATHILSEYNHPYRKVLRQVQRSDTAATSFEILCPGFVRRDEYKQLLAVVIKEFNFNVEPAKRSSATLFEAPDIERMIEILCPSEKEMLQWEQRNLLVGQVDQTWKEQWELTSPFLPFAEFLFLSCCLHPSSRPPTLLGDASNSKYLQARRAGERVLITCAELTHSSSRFARYLFSINDTWGSAIHHAVHSDERNPFEGEETFQPLLQLVLNMIPSRDDYVNAHDSLGRTPLQISLALGLSINRIKRLLQHPRTDVCASYPIPNWGHLVSANRKWELDVNIVSQVNGYMPYLDGYKPHNFSNVYDRAPFHLVIRSPHLPPKKREAIMCLLLETRERRDQQFDAYLKDSRSQRIDGPPICWNLNALEECRTVLFGELASTTPLQLAAYLGDAAMVLLLAENDHAYDRARLNNKSARPRDPRYKDYSALHVAALAGQPQAIRSILATGKFERDEDMGGNSALHIALHYELPLQFQFRYGLMDFCGIPFTRVGTPYKQEESLSPEERRELVRVMEVKRQGCVTFLLQAGSDIWQVNRSHEIADPGPYASPDYSMWWYEKLSRETQDARTRLNAAANAISVTAALVATASYVGPLQPPLGYNNAPDAPDGMQVNVHTVLFFIIFDTLAFYLALAAIGLSLIPSLPMPRESILDELTLIRRIVTAAVFFLITSTVAVLLAFGFASVAVMSNERSWNGRRVTITTFAVGGTICFVALTLCMFRIVGLAGHRDEGVLRFYRKFMYGKRLAQIIKKLPTRPETNANLGRADLGL